MTTFWATAYYVSFKGLFRWMSPSMYLAQKVVLPLAQLAFFAMLGQFSGAQPLRFYLIGNAIAIASISGVFSVARAVTADRGQGTLSYVVASPANRAGFFLGHAAFEFLDAVGNVVLAFVWAVLVFDLRLPVESWAGILVVILVAALAVSGLGLFVGALSFVVLDSAFLGNVVVFLILLVSGANIPSNELPGALALIGQFLPLTRSIAAGRALADGASLVSVAPTLAADVAVGAMYVVVAVGLQRWIERQALRGGSLEAF